MCVCVSVCKGQSTGIYAHLCLRSGESTVLTRQSPQKVGTGQSKAWTQVHQPLPSAGSAGPERDPWPSGEYIRTLTSAPILCQTPVKIITYFPWV